MGHDAEIGVTGHKAGEGQHTGVWLDQKAGHRTRMWLQERKRNTLGGMIQTKAGHDAEVGMTGHKDWGGARHRGVVRQGHHNDVVRHEEGASHKDVATYEAGLAHR